MAKQKIEIIELNLGIDPNLGVKPTINPQTESRIEHLKERQTQEQENITAYLDKKKQEEQSREEGVEKVYKILSSDPNTGLNSAELLIVANSADIVGTMVRLRNLIRKRGDLWAIRKNKIADKTVYRFKPTK